MRKKHPLRDLDADIRDHIARETEKNVERGMAPEEARYAALRKFGNVSRVKEDARAAWIRVWLEQVLQDLAFGVRTLRRCPSFATLVVCTLALGIGTTTAAASIVYSILYRPLTFANSEQLVRLWEQHPGVTPASTERWLSNLTFYAWNRHSRGTPTRLTRLLRCGATKARELTLEVTFVPQDRGSYEIADST